MHTCRSASEVELHRAVVFLLHFIFPIPGSAMYLSFKEDITRGVTRAIKSHYHHNIERYYEENYIKTT